MKKIINVLLIISMLFFAACGKSDLPELDVGIDTPPPTTETSSVTTEPETAESDSNSSEPEETPDVVPDAPESERLTFTAEDGLTITADLYLANDDNAPYIILFHGQNSNRGEFYHIAPRLAELGFNCLAVDLRAGARTYPVNPRTGSVFRVDNLTQAAGTYNANMHYEAVWPDVKAALLYTKDVLEAESIIVWGVAYSATLSIVLGSEFSNYISGIMLFSLYSVSPYNEWFNFLEFNDRKIEDYAADIKCPVFIVTDEDTRVESMEILDRISSDDKVYFDVVTYRDWKGPQDRPRWEIVLDDADNPLWDDVIQFLNSL